MGKSRKLSPAATLTEVELLEALIARVEAEGLRRDVSGSSIARQITNDTKFWSDMRARVEYLKLAEPPQGEPKTRSLSLEMRDRLLKAVAVLEAEKIPQAG
jgi:hypothetical protein